MALVNGYPVVHYDTGTLIKTSFAPAVSYDRPIFYPLLIRSSLLLADSLWPVIVLQSALTGGLLVFFLRRQLQAKRVPSWAPVAIIALLCLLSTLPWFAGFVKADLFAGLIFLAMITLLLHWSALRTAGRAGLVLVAAYSTTVHNSHLLIAAGFLVVLWVASRWLPRPPRSAFGACWIALLIGLAAVPIVNQRLSGRFEYSSGGEVFLFARFVEHGAVSRLLRDRCEDEAYALCPYRDRLEGVSGDFFLWEADSPLHEIGGWRGSKDAIRPMLLDVVRYYPGDLLTGTVRSVGAQLVMFATGSGTRPYDETKVVHQQIQAQFAREFPTWQRSLQQRGKLEGLGTAMRWIHLPLMILALLWTLAVGFVPRISRRLHVADESRFLAQAIWFFVAVNGAVCGTLSAQNDRYGGRVIWLVLLVALLIAVQVHTGTRLSNGAADNANGLQLSGHRTAG